jgi:RNA polymerase sigma factor (sigma-70 family)
MKTQNPSPDREKTDCIFPMGGCTVEAMDEPLDTWFKREILAHEGALVRYLRRMWPRRDEVEDLRQETYVRVYRAAGISRPVSARSFLFTTAHHLMTDRVRRERIVSIEAMRDMETLNVPVDEISVERRVSALQELRRLAQALDLLPPKCRQVVWLRRVEELSHRQIAQQLGIKEKTVEKHISKGGRLLAEYMLSDDEIGSVVKRTVPALEDDSEHGKQ